MADVIDSSQTFTIKRILLEGNLYIYGIEAPTEATPGETIPILVGIENYGGEDTGFVWLKDTDTGEYLLKDGKFDVPGYSTFTITISGLVMPNIDLNLTVEAGHVE